MEITCEAEIYSPSVDQEGRYIDSLPPNCKYGIRCPCSSRKEKIYENNRAFCNHLKTKMHIKWLEELNNNRSNYFVENIRLQDTIKNQKEIIAKMEIELKNKILTIDYLTNILLQKEKKEKIEKEKIEKLESELNLLDI